MSAQPILQAINVTKSYECPTETVTPLRNLNFEVQEGDFILIYGPSGSGKTTLLNVLCGIDRISHGRIYFMGEPLDTKRDWELTQLRRMNLGVIFQSFELISVMTCYDNIEYPLLLQGVPPKERKRRITKIADMLEIGGLLSRKPEKISGGQKQRVSICRALVGNYKIILGDEITGSLDSDLSERVYSHLKDINYTQGRTFVMVTHNPDLRRYANRVLHLTHGTLQEETL